MKLICCSVLDHKTGAFMRPFFMLSEGQALRSFQDEVNRDEKDNIIYSHPDDFSLFLVGDFDDADGRLSVVSPPKLISHAASLKLA